MLQSHGCLSISLVLSPLPPCLTARAMDGTSMQGHCAKSLGAVKIFGVPSLWDHPLDSCDQKGNGKTGGTKTSREFAVTYFVFPFVLFIFFF